MNIGKTTIKTFTIGENLFTPEISQKLADSFSFLDKDSTPEI